jgi:membrane protease subunit (stomatin/prohibitin family)
MGIFDIFKKQFIQVIEWTETENGVISYRYPMNEQEIQNGAHLTVRDSQVALFVNEGEIADLFEPGRHTLSTKNLPILTTLKNWDKLFQSPFKSDVYFFSTRDQLDQKWGTAQPITLRDKEFGPIRLRAFGSYSYRLKNPKVFFKKVSGTREQFTVKELEGQLRSMILTSMSSFFGSSEVQFLDMAASQVKFSETLRNAFEPSFLEYGLKLESFFVESISLPSELQTYLDKVASMKIVGDLQHYAKFQSADSISIAASNPSGGAGLATGIAMGQAVASQLQQMSPSQGSEDPVSLLNKLHELFKKGIITQAEFEEKKTELLKKIK